MSSPYLAEIRIMGFSYAPRGWAQCNGAIMSIAQNQALFSILGTSYGGDGRVTFGLPDLRGRVPVHPGRTITIVGATGGEEGHTLLPTEIPQHVHLANASKTAGNSQYIAQVFPQTGQNIPATAGTQALYNVGLADVKLNASSIQATGGNQPHENRQPFSVLNFCIALAGVFPSRN
jgi:microcystin-dependent protein